MKRKFAIAAVLTLVMAVPTAYAFARMPLPPAYPPTPVTTSCPQLSLNLYMGLHDWYAGGQVSALQQFLNARYGNQLVTGFFGPMTYANVARFQQEQSVYPVTGGVGPLTRAAIARVCDVVVTPPPPIPSNPTFSATPLSGTAPLAVTFTTSTTVYDAAQYIVEFGDGTNSGPVTVGTIAHTYNMPGVYTATLTRYVSCLYSNPRCMIAVQSLGQVSVYVGAPPVQANTLNVTSPTAGQVYTRGNQMTISWSGLIRETFVYEPHASIVDLYSTAGYKVGTIAITNDLTGVYQWSVPSFRPDMACTMQYPNGLCGQNLQGQYYIVVTAIVGNAFEQNPTVIGTAQSGVFTIQ